MLRSMIFNCNSTHPHPIVWGGVGWGGIITSLAFPHDLDATLYDLHWHFHMILMLRSMIFIGISTWTWCYALWSSIAIPHDLDATLYDLHWHFHMILMLRSMIFIGISTWSWCYALWSSLAFPHDLDATLYDLHGHFHMNLMLLSMIFIIFIGISTWNLMLRSMIFIGISTWSWCYALWSSLAFPHELDATLYDLQCEKKLRLPFLWHEVMEGLLTPKVDGPFFDRFWHAKTGSYAVRT